MANPRTARKHAIQRLKSRQGVKDISLVKDIVAEVLEKGIRVKDYPECCAADLEVKSLLFKKFKSNTQRKRTYIYNENIYIFNKDNVLITTYPLTFIRRKVYDK